MGTMETSLAFCTYFDSRYLPRGLALYESLCRHAPGARLHVLCMDDVAFAALTEMALPGLVPIRLDDFEAGDEGLRAAKANRSVVEYYFTCTPSLPLYVLRHHSGIERVFYVDADLYFFSSAAAVLEEWGDGSVYIVDHRYPESLRGAEKYGRFNVGILGFRNDGEGRRCLEHWRRQCNAWCYDRLEDGKFADQKYLDAWPEAYRGVVVSGHPGVNVAPWNKSRYRLELREGVPCVNGRPIVCYHFHGVKLYRFGLVEPQPYTYGPKLDGDWIHWVYEPYLRELARAGRPATGHNGDLRFRRPLSLGELTTRGARGQVLLRTGDRWLDIPASLMESVRLARRGAGRLRNIIQRGAGFVRRWSER
jgi:hypothetical protein